MESLFFFYTTAPVLRPKNTQPAPAPPLPLTPKTLASPAFMSHRKVPRRQRLSLQDRLSSVVRLADEIMQGAASSAGEGGGRRGVDREIAESTAH